MMAIRYSTTQIAFLLLSLVLVFTLPLLAAGPPSAVVYSFGAFAFGDATYPAAGLVADAAGNLYGSAVMGGANGNGTVFKLSPPATAGGAWTETLLYSFGPSATDGGAPDSTLVFDAAGNLYGTTESGGTGGLGTVFELSPPATSGGEWTKTTIFSFPANRTSGVLPVGKLAFDPAGNLYGATPSGGIGAKCLNSQGCGVVYKLSPPATAGSPWTQSVLHNFGSTKQDGTGPLAGVLYRGGNLFGTTWQGGANGQGIVYVLVPNGISFTERILHTFNSTDGAGPTAGLIADSSSNLYGTTDAGGSSTNCTIGCGTVFQLSPPAAAGGAWTLTTLYSFTRGRDGANPLSALWRSQAGDLYGTTNNGGFASGPSKNSGTFFRLNHPTVAAGAWTLGTLHAFTDSPADGADPQSEVILIKNHVFYGVTVFGGTNGTGAVFSVGP